jgi:alcohol dehydrogenase (cytochrome c)
MRALVASLVACALALSAVLALAQESPQANPFAGNADAIAAGKVIYDTTCAGCHGTNGAGNSAPPLNRALARAQTDADVFRLVRDGIEDTAMPAFPALSDDNVWRIIAYVRSLVAASSAPVPLVAAANAKAGEAIFYGRGGCTACHELDGLGRDLASDLSAIGVKPPADIRAALAHEPMPQRFVTVVTAKGERMAGIVRGEDLFTLHLKQRDGTLVMLSKSTLKSITDTVNPMLPPRLGDDELADLTAFLAQRMGRNLAETTKLIPPALLAYPRIAAPEFRNWVTQRGTLDGGNFSTLSGINAAAAPRLQARWSAQLGDGMTAATPLVVDGVIYVSGAAGNVYAFDAQSGIPIWRFQRSQVLQNTTPVGGNRGVALLDGRVFVGTADNKLIALDAHNGRQLWERQLASTLDGYTMNGAPLALRTRLVTGVAGMGAKARGWLEAVDPANGKAMWRLDTTANAPGAMTAAMGAYEAQNVTLYWSTTRANDDGPSSDAILALNANTGAMTWAHKLAPGAGGNNVVLAEQGKRALLLHLGRDGLLTVLDRATAKPVLTQSIAKERIETPALSFDRSSSILYAGLGNAAAAVDSRNGRVLWRSPLPVRVAGILATRGGVVFATLADGQIVALGAKDGKPLWSFRAAGPMAGTPVSYSVNGKQYVAVTAGNMLYAFTLPN